MAREAIKKMRTEILIKRAGRKEGKDVAFVSASPLRAIVLLVDPTEDELKTFFLGDDQEHQICFETPGLRSAKKPDAKNKRVRRGQTKHKV